MVRPEPPSVENEGLWMGTGESSNRDQGGFQPQISRKLKEFFAIYPGIPMSHGHADLDQIPVIALLGSGLLSSNVCFWELKFKFHDSHSLEMHTLFWELKFPHAIGFHRLLVFLANFCKPLQDFSLFPPHITPRETFLIVPYMDFLWLFKKWLNISYSNSTFKLYIPTL